MQSKRKTDSPPLERTALPLSAAALTSIGRVRKRNEDALFIDAGQRLFMVSDGMGGAPAGDVAAKMVTTILPRMLQTRLAATPYPPGQTIRSWLRQDLLLLSREIYLKSIGNPLANGMGATIVVMLVGKNCAYVGHLGDSRAYLYRAKRLVQLTRDHTVVSLLMRAGEITEDEARVHPARGQLTRFMGMKEEVYGDIKSVRLKNQDRLLLCTDGLTGMVPDTEVSQILNLFPDPATASRMLIDAANEAGGKDNVSALVVDVGGQ